MVYAWVLVCLLTLVPAISEPACLLACSQLACHKLCLPAYEFHAIPSLFLLLSSPSSTFSCLRVRWHVLGGLFKSISLFSGNSCIAALSVIASVSIGHSENVICFNSLICSTVAWDWNAKLMARYCLFDAKEDLVCCIKALSLTHIQFDTGIIGVESCSILFEVLFLHNIITFFIICASIEFPYGDGIDWLLQVLLNNVSNSKQKKRLTIFLLFYMCLLRDWLQQLLQQCRVEYKRGPKTVVSY